MGDGVEESWVESGNAVVVLWGPSLSSKSLGHLSLTLADDTHISFWPKNKLSQVLTGKRARAATSLEEDVLLLGRPPSDTLPIPACLLDQARTRAWWAHHSHHTRYNLVLNNCAVVVKEALEAGGLILGRQLDYQIYTSPTRTFNLIKQCIHYYQSWYSRRTS